MVGLFSSAHDFQCHILIVSDLQHSMSIINAPAHKWPTLLTALENLYQLNRKTYPDKNGKVMVTLDMDLYKHALKLEYLDHTQINGGFYRDLSTQAFVLSDALRKTVEHSGLDEAWIQSGLLWLWCCQSSKQWDPLQPRCLCP